MRTMTKAVIDTSTWISLARAGLLPLLSKVPLEAVLTDVVEQEAIVEGLAGGHGDAAAIRDAARGPVLATSNAATTIDEAVLLAARDIGALVTNDVALGRRARTMGVRWLRTADLIIVAARRGALPSAEARRAVQSLHASGRITAELAAAYHQELL